MEEGVSGEASSLAGHQKLGDLMVIYDDNNISIEDDTNIALSEDVGLRYEAYGWHVQTSTGADRTGPTSRTWPRWRPRSRRPRRRPSGRRSSGCARSSPGPRRTRRTPARRTARRSAPTRSRATKKVLGLDPDKTFDVDPRGARARPRGAQPRPRRARGVDSSGSRPGPRPTPERRQLLDRLLSPRAAGRLGGRRCPTFDPDPKGIATRKASGNVLDAIVPVLPELWGGSADLAESNNTTPKGEPSFIPTEHQTKEFPGGPYGRVLHFGIREHAMGSIMNGIALHGGPAPYGGTFLVFSDYMRPAVRLGRADEAAGHLRVDARLDRPRRGRPDPPADRAPGRAARDPRPRRRAARPTRTRPRWPGGRSWSTPTGRPRCA